MSAPKTRTITARSGNRSPILVTGMPRSGTTWVARRLAGSERTALAGREPMNPHRRQWALGGTLDGWARITDPTPRQRRLLTLAYRGLMPFVYSRYGLRQWAAPLPWTRLVVKDPFAVLSVPAVVEVTGATAVVVYRHPGAILTSYRRMGWRPDMDEVGPLVDIPPAAPLDDRVDPLVGTMARFWTALYRTALDDAARTPGTILVAHEDLAAGGDQAMTALAALCGLTWTPPAPGQDAGDAEPSAPAAPATAAESTRLHDFDRTPELVAHAWRAKVTDDELAVLEHHAGETLAALARVKAALLD